MTADDPELALHCHPATANPVVRCVTVQVVPQGDGGLALRYRIDAAPEAVRVPPPQTPGPADRLWTRTCFEAFVALADDEAYREFNFSPSGEWAAYAFSRYRKRDPAHDPDARGRLELAVGETGLTLAATLDAALLPPRRAGARLALGLTAVVEDGTGSLSYWALAHPSPQPDFHHRAGFVLELDWAPATDPSVPPCR